MNYVCVVIVGYTAYSILYWKYKGKKEFHALEESENEQAEYSNNFDTIEDSREFSVAASDVELENEHVPWGKKWIYSVDQSTVIYFKYIICIEVIKVNFFNGLLSHFRRGTKIFQPKYPSGFALLKVMWL